jgi:hypothetical protein
MKRNLFITVAAPAVAAGAMVALGGWRRMGARGPNSGAGAAFERPS